MKAVVVVGGGGGSGEEEDERGGRKQVEREQLHRVDGNGREGYMGSGCWGGSRYLTGL